jgi:hypothetical protein
MLYENLFELLEHANLMPIEYMAFALGALVVAGGIIRKAIRLSRRMQDIHAQISRMEKRISTLEMQESRRLMTKLNANSKREIDHSGLAIEIDNDVEGLTVSPPTTPAQPESPKFAKITAA